MTLNAEQVEALLAPLDPRRVRQVQGNSHLEAWDVRRHLLRVFGWGGWDFQVVTCDCISERSVWDEKNPLKGRHTVVYRVVGRLTIKDTDGTVLAVFEDGATGDGANQPSIGDAHDMAMKTAMSQALKRCAMNLGDRFGLSLYAKGNTTAVVGGSIAHGSGKSKQDVAEHVEAGEMDEPERPAERSPVPPEQDPWQNPDLVQRPPVVTNAAWLKDISTRIATCDAIPVLRGLHAEVGAEVKGAKVSPADAADLAALIEERSADLAKTATVQAS